MGRTLEQIAEYDVGKVAKNTHRHRIWSGFEIGSVGEGHPLLWAEVSIKEYDPEARKGIETSYLVGFDLRTLKPKNKVSIPKEVERECSANLPLIGIHDDFFYVSTKGKILRFNETGEQEVILDESDFFGSKEYACFSWASICADGTIFSYLGYKTLSVTPEKEETRYRLKKYNSPKEEGILLFETGDSPATALFVYDEKTGITYVAGCNRRTTRPARGILGAYSTDLPHKPQIISRFNMPYNRQGLRSMALNPSDGSVWISSGAYTRGDIFRLHVIDPANGNIEAVSFPDRRFTEQYTHILPLAFSEKGILYSYVEQGNPLVAFKVNRD